MTDPKDPKSKKPKRRPRKSTTDKPRVIVVNASRGNICGAVATITDTLIEVLSAMATGLAEVKATLDDRDATTVFDEIELNARKRGNEVLKTLAGLPVAEAVLAAGAALHEVVAAYKQAYAEAAQRVSPAVAALDGECGHTEAEHAEMAASIASAVSNAAAPTIPMGRMRGRDAGH